MDRTLSLPDLVRLFAPAQPRDPVGDGNGTAGDRLSHRPRPGSRPPNAGAPVRLGAFEGSHYRHGAAGRDHRDENRANPAVGTARAAPAVRVIAWPKPDLCGRAHRRQPAALAREEWLPAVHPQSPPYTVAYVVDGAAHSTIAVALTG